MKKTIAVLLAMAISMALVFSLSGCFKGGEKIDKNKTQLYVNNFQGGYGDEWLYSAKAGFEAKYKDVKLETDKTGVQVIINSAKVKGSAIANELRNGSDEVFFNEYVFYHDFLAEDLLLDITEAVTNSLSDFGENKTIEEKLTPEQVSYYKKDNKYYGLPHYASYNSIMYDADLFEKEFFYFAENKNNGNQGFIISKDDQKSAGRDGIKGTFDDGLPATYSEFFELLNRIKNSATVTIPLIWTGRHSNSYLEKLIHALYADFEGVDQMMLNYNFGDSEIKATNLVSSITGSGNDAVLVYDDATTITKENGYELYRQAGRYYALDFIERILKDSRYYDTLSFNLSQSHTDTQNRFLLSTLDYSQTPIAMIVEGTWWENEASSSMQVMAETYGDHASRQSRRFGYMPLPKADSDRAAQGYTLYDTLYSLAFVSKRIPSFKVDIAKKFIQYVNTDAMLEDFNVITNTPKALKYTLSSQALDKMTFFGKSLYQIHEAADIVYPYSSNNFYLNNQSSFETHEVFTSLVGGSTYDTPIAAMRNYNITAKQLFEGMMKYYKDNKWANYLDK